MMCGKIGVTFLKTTLTFVLVFAVFKLIIGWYYGYKNINGVYGGSYFYNWRVNHVDPKVSKTFYKPIGLNEQDLGNKILYKYLDHVQGTDRDTMTKGYDFDNKKYIPEKEDGPKRTELPYYAYGFTDAFVYTSNKNWMLFNDNEKKLEMELDFLKLRGKFISELYEIKNDDANFETYFGYVDKDNKKVNGKTIKKGQFFTELNKKKVAEFFNKNNDFIDAKKFINIIIKIINNEKDYKLTMTKDSATMQDALKTDVMDLVDSTFQEKKLGFKVSEDDVNNFFYRIAVIKMRPMDAHILNRIYSFCTMLFTGIPDDKIDVPEYKDYINKINEHDKNIKSIDSTNAGAEKERIKRKLDILKKKKNAFRVEIMFVKISQLFASLYNDGNFIMQSKDDKRPFLERYGSPKLALENDFKKDAVSWKKNKNLFNTEITSLAGSF